MSEINFIVPLAKQAGLTSFASLSCVKKALGTKKIGHTGTLDLFADGLLILVTGKLTRIAELIASGKKTYQVLAHFGEETNTLDPEGIIIKTAALPQYGSLISAIPSFLGTIEQVPPEFSAIKINGKRASDRIRTGGTVEMKMRKVSIYSIEVLAVMSEKGRVIHHSPELLIKYGDCKIKSAYIKVECSKGTYIRSLIRDIASFIGSCAYVKALRRTCVGSFSIEKAAGFSFLPKFEMLSSDRQIVEIPIEQIRESAFKFTVDAAEKLNLMPIMLDEKYLNDFYNGKPLKSSWFNIEKLDQSFCSKDSEQKDNKRPVFCNGIFIGIISANKNHLKYEAVIK